MSPIASSTRRSKRAFPIELCDTRVSLTTPPRHAATRCEHNASARGNACGRPRILPYASNCRTPFLRYNVMKSRARRRALLQLAGGSRLGDHVTHRGGERREILGADDERRHQIDDVAERTYPDTVLNEARAQRFELWLAVELHYTDGPFHTHIAHAAKPAACGETRLELRCNGRDLLEPGLRGEKIERRVGRRAREWIAGIGRAVHQCVPGVIAR